MSRKSWKLEDIPSESTTPTGLIRKALSYFGGIATLVAIGATAIMYKGCTTYVGPDEFGVRQVNMVLGEEGIRKGVVNTGIRREVMGLETIHKFPKKIQVLTLRDSEKGSKEESDYVEYIEEANIQTSDGYTLDLDVSVIYRITDPYTLLTEIGAGETYISRLKSQAEPILKATLGKLNPEDFFNPSNRISKQAEALKAFNKEFLEKGIEVKHVLMRNPHYNPQVQEKIEDRTIEEQRGQLNAMLGSESETFAVFTN